MRWRPYAAKGKSEQALASYWVPVLQGRMSPCPDHPCGSACSPRAEASCAEATDAAVAWCRRIWALWGECCCHTT